MSKLQACSDEATTAVNALVEKYDVRLVLASIAARFAELSAVALAVGVERRFVHEIVVGALDIAFTPTKTTPQVIYIDGNEVLGRKN